MESLFYYSTSEIPLFIGGPTNEHGLMPFLTSFVPEEIQYRIHAIIIQQVVSYFQSNYDFDWVDEFMKKYGMVY